MCGRYTSTSSAADLASLFHVEEVKTEPLPPRYNVPPTAPVYAVALSKKQKRQLGTFRWGLVPSWAKERSAASKLINARAETVASKPSFRAALARRRCLIPADSFFEWQRRAGSASPDGEVRPGGKLPFVVRRRDGAPLAFAGLWEVWRDPDDPDAEPLRTCAIVTTSANSLMAPIHNRMPVILEASSWADWLAPDADRADLAALMLPAAVDLLETYAVSSLVNKVANDGPELLVPLPPPAARVFS